MRVLVTGGAGFIGSHTVDVLVEAGFRVAVLDNLSSGSMENIKHPVNFYHGDITDRTFVSHCMKRENPEVVFHLAAQASVPVSLQDPAADARVNIVGTLILLEAARAENVRKVVFASSAAVYGFPEYLPVDELHQIRPVSGYGLSKYAAERYLELYKTLYGLDYTVLRYANVYGPRQNAGGEGGVVAIFTDRIARGEEPVIYGDGEQTRDFVHVLDVARANVSAVHRGGGMTLNIGTGRPVTVNRLFEIVSGAAAYTRSPRYGQTRPGDIRDSSLDSRRAGEYLGWVPGIELEQGINDMIGKTD
ncbi:MAG: NAD-dependent epimerase/dehydratase family protein [Bacillota bacterium]